jgi:hypothetical protein
MAGQNKFRHALRSGKTVHINRLVDQGIALGLLVAFGEAVAIG